MQAFQEAGLAHISGSATDPTLTQGDDDTTTFFRTVPTDDVQGPSDASFITNVLGVTKLYIIDDKSTYSVGLADQAEAAFTDAGGEVVGREQVEQNETDFSSLATVIISTGAEAIFFPGQIATQGAALAKNLKEQGSSIILVGADGFQNVKDFIEGGAGATEGAYVSAFAPDVRGVESAVEIVERYIAQYDDSFTSFGPPSYAATMVLLEAIQRASDAGNLTREGVLAEVANTNQELSVLGTPLAFDERGDVLGASFYMFQVQDGSFVLVPVPAAEPMAEATEEG
jgi:branched-chain amino acid transport system substrate-binding protein